MSQQVGGTTRKISDSSCSEAYANSLKCLDKNKYDKAKCKDAFDAYKKCKKDQASCL
ncbi:hypothetical protein CHLNCDRAFT_137348 [Chlorella variabilis]|uniref:CHCH domain-containing protein n=1 Tax=Chlorella variabilis TaxID=554065 RepID=E1ZM82_CHLVA|nr:hypothetical protein CHLNCDRAFT_137348 [Chlorella variabilis]EFN52960.1 hypothetical protein CHLNCDRAFT_137348 [Chlorella variabilis]|eukprot:XP_005845062.1 hypothetical protein CHLNCDRAFT_137348 [Chlorella variabilis]